MTDQPNDIDIEAERKLFEHVAAIPGLILTRHRHDYYRYADPMTDHCWYVHTERARIAAERERELQEEIKRLKKQVPKPRPTVTCTVCQGTGWCESGRYLCDVCCGGGWMYYVEEPKGPSDER